ncbi:7TM diverse intracellular signaling domain-containing protein [Ramlibacter tataouinensis]|uniref:sensor domain-containing diguanylate cyclase n=1 Tax=Ramlibacter tataouinensis TaxID=94132 RepID=UPI0022F3E080|nr:7TM diverse intracellular signaling domain-containing protein [Ramlibacter tataouinensis]WBY00762.1 7TM diverse intracellular signaling domain-containing protein [Ramlibacter tataouinensis]
MGTWRDKAAGAVAAWVMLLLMLAWAPGARADRVIALDPAVGQATLDSAGSAWLDVGGRATLADAMRQDRGWRATAPDTVYPLRHGDALWFRFTLAETDESERWFLEVPYPAVNRVTLYTPNGQGLWLPMSAGDTLPVAHWPLPHRHPLLPLQLVPGEPQQFFVRVENPHSFGAPLRFTSERQLLLREQRTGFMLGLYFGLASLSVLLAVLAAAALRDRAFGWYAATILLMGLAQACLTGVAGLHLWPALGWWNDIAAMALPVVGSAALLGFFSAVISLPQRSRRLHRLLVAVALLCLLAAAALPLVPPGWRVRLMVPAIVLSIAAGLFVNAWAARRGDRNAGWLLAGLAPVLVLSAFPLARTWGLIPLGFWSAYGMPIGIAIELPVLLAVLARRSQDRRENFRRIQGLVRTDPATGLINAQVFAERLTRLIARSERLRLQSVVLLVDIANIEQIRRDFDRRQAEEMPLWVAGRLLSAVRDIDSVARLSEHRFGMIVEGPLTPEEAAGTGARVVARCLMPFKGKPLGWVAQVRVAQTVVPNGSDARQVIERLSAVLATVPLESKRAVFTIR